MIVIIVLFLYGQKIKRIPTFFYVGTLLIILPAKVGLYFVSGKSLKMLCNIFKGICLLIGFLQEFFDGFFQLFDRFEAFAQHVVAVHEEHRRQVGQTIQGDVR